MSRPEISMESMDPNYIAGLMEVPGDARPEKHCSTCTLTSITDAGAPVPIKKPNPQVQMTPIVQPVAFVPYSSQKQALYTNVDGDSDEEFEVDDYGNDELAERFAEGDKPAKKSKPYTPPAKKVSGAALALIILSFVELALVFFGQVSTAFESYLKFTADATAYDLIVKLINDATTTNLEVFSLGYLINGMLALGVVALAITILASLIRIMRKGACVVAKIGTVLLLLTAAAALVYAIISNTALGYAMYAYVAIALIMLLVAFIAKKSNK